MSILRRSSLQKYNNLFKLKRQCRSRRLKLGFLVLLANQILLISIQAMYLQHPYHGGPGLLSRRQDSDDDEMDSNASAPYQNQDESNRNADGYEDPEADGPYGETPREEEGQADLERFFDDHLGASERDGMDKENLPTNLAPVVLLQNLQQDAKSNLEPLKPNQLPVMVPYRRVDPPIPQTHYQANSYQPQPNYRTIGGRPDLSYKLNQSRTSDTNFISASLTAPSSPEPTSSFPRIETSYVRLPDNKLIITRHITRDLLRKPDFVPPQEQGTDVDHLSDSNKLIDNDEADGASDLSPMPSYRESRRPKTQAPVVRLEDDEMDTVYVTNVTDKPFRIAALGGYDPEEDFRDASLDISDSESNSRTGSRSTRWNARMQPASSLKDSVGQFSQDITFGDPEADSMFNDASETDEVTFDAGDDPYQTDLEAELHAQAYDQPGQVSQVTRRPSARTHYHEREGATDVEVEIEPAYVKKNRRAGGSRRDRKTGQKLVNSEHNANRRKDDSDDDESEGGWLNDGVDDMEIPSKRHQESVLKKAALAAQARHDEDGAKEDGKTGSGVEGGVDANQDPVAQEEPTKSEAIDQPAQYAGDEGDQRMPNADYLRDDLKVDDLDYKA